MTVGNQPGPLITIDGLVKSTLSPPLRVSRLAVAATDRMVLTGLSHEAAEIFVHLVTGAALPDEGRILIDGLDTREIATDADWLRSLDQFGLVSERAVLIDALTVEANLALPLTVSINPVAEPVRAEVRRLAAEVGLDPSRLDAQTGTLTTEERVRVRLARALAPRPRLLLLEHPTRTLDRPEAAVAFGQALVHASDSRQVGWLAISDDERFARATGGRRVRVDPARGTVRSARPQWFRRLFLRGDR